jgi:hypothetical protein
MLLTSTNCGTNVTMPGTIRVPRTSRKTTRRPGNGSFASAYPSSEQKTRLPAVTSRATIVELAKNVG